VIGSSVQELDHGKVGILETPNIDQMLALVDHLQQDEV